MPAMVKIKGLNPGQIQVEAKQRVQLSMWDPKVRCQGNQGRGLQGILLINQSPNPTVGEGEASEWADPSAIFPFSYLSLGLPLWPFF